MLQYAMSNNMSLQNGDFWSILAFKWPQSQKIHNTEAFKCQNQKLHFKITPENINFEYHF